MSDQFELFNEITSVEDVVHIVNEEIIKLYRDEYKEKIIESIITEVDVKNKGARSMAFITSIKETNGTVTKIFTKGPGFFKSGTGGLKQSSFENVYSENLALRIEGVIYKLLQNQVPDIFSFEKAHMMNPLKIFNSTGLNFVSFEYLEGLNTIYNEPFSEELLDSFGTVAVILDALVTLGIYLMDFKITNLIADSNRILMFDISHLLIDLSKIGNLLNLNFLPDLDKNQGATFPNEFTRGLAPLPLHDGKTLVQTPESYIRYAINTFASSLMQFKLPDRKFWPYSKNPSFPINTRDSFEFNEKLLSTYPVKLQDWIKKYMGFIPENEVRTISFSQIHAEFIDAINTND